MARTGRPRTPTRLLELRGTFRPDRHADRADEPQPPKVQRAPAPPAWLDATGKRVWKRVVRELIALELYTTLDVETLEGYCAAHARAVAAEKMVKKAGLTYVTDQGQIVARPEVAMARTSWALVKQLGGELGLSPRARTTVRTPEKPKVPATDPFSEFARRRAAGADAGSGGSGA